VTRPAKAPAGRFDWRRFFDLAERLGQEVDDEAALRSAISRAYYAVFALARRRLREQGCLPVGRDPHLRVWGTYRDAGSQVCRRIGDLGFNLLDQRKRADYEDWIGKHAASEAARALDHAREILDLLDRLDPAESCCPPGTGSTTP
jgi:uncharacterized protein (UPF0332 family)